MVGGRYVKYHDQQLNWTDAYLVCRNEGAQLITVRDDATTDWLISRYNTIWIGLTDHVKERERERERERKREREREREKERERERA